MHFRRTKTLSIISHDNYNLNAIEDFVKLSLPSKLHALLTVSLWNKNPGQLLVYSMKRNIYIGFWTLKVKCTYYEMCGEMTFKNARAMDFFFKVEQEFWWGPQNLDLFVGVAPACIYLPRKARDSWHSLSRMKWMKWLQWGWAPLWGWGPIHSNMTSLD